MMKHFKSMRLALLGLLGAFLPSCQSDRPGTMTATTKEGHTVTVTAINDNIVKVTNVGKGERSATTQAAVLDQQPFNGTIAREGDISTMTLPSGLTATLASAPPRQSQRPAAVAYRGRDILWSRRTRPQPGA